MTDLDYIYEDELHIEGEDKRPSSYKQISLAQAESRRRSQGIVTVESLGKLSSKEKVETNEEEASPGLSHEILHSSIRHPRLSRHDSLPKPAKIILASTKSLSNDEQNPLE